jgi:hypothetical protein
VAESDEELLRTALECVGAGWRATGYRFVPVNAGTQATVWHGWPEDRGLPEVALRLTSKPAELVARIGRLIDSVTGVECPATLAVGEMRGPGGPRTVQVCTWVGRGPANRSRPHHVGRALARLHHEMAGSAVDVSDRPLRFAAERPVGRAQAPRELWRDRVELVLRDGWRLPVQPVHGDMHWANIVAGRQGGFGFIDFDKVMLAPGVFDLAKLVATGFFRDEGATACFDQAGAARLVAGYLAERPLDRVETDALEGYAILLNEQTAALGEQLDLPGYRRQAVAVGAWWTDPGRDRGDPLGIRAAARAIGIRLR